jgi:hypothetical protein
MIPPRLVAACLVSFLLVVVGLSGCNLPPGGDESGDPVAYALDIKTQVTQTLTQAKAEPASALDGVTVLIENLEGYHSQPIGEHGATYASLLAGCRQLKEMIGQSAGRAQIVAKIDEVLATAGKLPGQVAAQYEEEGGASAPD